MRFANGGERQVPGAHLHARGAQVLGQDLPDLAIADERDPLHGQSMYRRPARASGSRIAYMSRPRSPPATRPRLAPPLAPPWRGASRVAAARSRGTQTTPSSSATITSPGVTHMPAQTTGMFTEPSVALIVPLALIALLHTGNCISCSVFTSRTPASITSARAPRAWKLVASRSPK